MSTIDLGNVDRWYLSMSNILHDKREVPREDYVAAAIGEGFIPPDEAAIISTYSFTGMNLTGVRRSFNTVVHWPVGAPRCRNCRTSLVKVKEIWNDRDPVTGDPVVRDREIWRHKHSLYPGSAGPIECFLPAIMAAACPS